MQLYVDSQFVSPYALSAFVCLVEKKLKFEIETVDLANKANRPVAFAARSITRRVPTLVQDDFSLSESSAIAEYLNDTLPGPSLYPLDARERARARQIQAWLRSDLMLIRDERPSVVVFHGTRFPPLSTGARDSAHLLFAAAEGLLKEKSDNLFGDWCIADVDLAMMLNRLVLHGEAVPQRLAKYAAHQWRRPAVQAWLAYVAESRGK